MGKLNFAIDESRCIHCDSCVKECPRRIICDPDPVPSIPPEMEENCMACQHCLTICPPGAVSIFGKHPEDSIPLNSETLPTPHKLATLLRGRRSIRRFRQENVDKALIHEIMATVSNAPTGCNAMDVHFSLIDDIDVMHRFLGKVVAGLENAAQSGRDVPEHLLKAAAKYRESGIDTFFRGAPHLLVATTGEQAVCGPEDIIISLTYFELLAHSFGLGATWCGYLKFVTDAVPELKLELGIAENKYLYGVMFGKPAIRHCRTAQRDEAAKIRVIK